MHPGRPILLHHACLPCLGTKLQGHLRSSAFKSHPLPPPPNQGGRHRVSAWICQMKEPLQGSSVYRVLMNQPEEAACTTQC